MNDVLGNGAGPSGFPGGGGLVAYPDECFQTPQLDLTVPTLGIELVPAKPGYYPMFVNGRWLIESHAGTQTTPPTTQAGSDAGHVNFLANASTTPANADVNNANPPSISTSINAGTVNTVQRIPNATVFFDVVAGAQGTGGFALRGKFTCIVKWVATG